MIFVERADAERRTAERRTAERRVAVTFGVGGQARRSPRLHPPPDGVPPTYGQEMIS